MILPRIPFARLAAASAMAVLIGCASTDVTPIGAGERPEDLSSDEAGLWLQMEKAEEDLRTAAIVVRDEELNDYVRSVTCKVTGADYCEDVRIYIVDVPAFNASMAPNGLMLVYTGLLLRAENEAQLAFVLGHEFGHYRERHSLQGWRAAKRVANASLFLAIAVGSAGAPEASVLGDLALYGRLFSFNREQEREADEVGYTQFVSAGYDGSQAAGLWQAIIDEVESSSSERKKRRLGRAGIFATHPLSSERVEYLTARAEGANGGRLGVISHRNAIRPFLEQWLDTDISRRDLGEHVFLIERLQDLGLDQGVLAFRLGEAYRVRREKGDLQRAKEAYALAVTFEDAPASAWRELGNVARRLGDMPTANAAYRGYLDRAPDATDRAVVESLLDKSAALPPSLNESEDDAS